MEEPTGEQIAWVLRRLTAKTRDINRGVLTWPGNEDTIEIATVPAINDWLEGMAVRVQHGEAF